MKHFQYSVLHDYVLIRDKDICQSGEHKIMCLNIANKPAAHGTYTKHILRPTPDHYRG